MLKFKKKVSLVISLVIIVGFLMSSCEEVLFETDISNEKVTLLAPVDGATLSFTSVSFNWSSIEEASQYHLQIASPDFSSADQIVVDELLDSITVYTKDLTINDYQWRVKAINSGFETDYATASFSIIGNDDFSDNVVALISPENNLVTNVSSQMLDWADINGATNYRVQIIDNISQDILDEVQTIVSEFEYTFGEGNLLWQVRAETDTQQTLFSARNILIDTFEPNTPVLSMPEDQAQLTDGAVTFSWQRELLAGSVEFDSIYIYTDENLTTLVQKDRAISPYSADLSNNTYYWFVRAFDQAGNESEDSSIFSFSIN